MSANRSRDLLRALSLAAGPPGAEGEVRGVVRDALAGVGTLRHDRLGSLLCEVAGDAPHPRVVLDSHLDEVAFMIQSVTSDGRLPFVPLGGWWAHTLLGQRVDVITERGRVPGVVASKPPHFLSADERERLVRLDQMSIDVGASSREEVEALGLRVGDMAVPRAEFLELSVPGVIAGKAFDNRVGVALMCETLLDVVGAPHPNTLIGVGAVQEELGGRGAGTATELARPDVAVVLECTPADDLPGQTERQAVLGGGPQLRFFDPTAVANRRLARFVEDVARDCGVTLQIAVRRTGGTDAQSVHVRGSGVPAVVLGVPARYIHSHTAILRWDDYAAARRLVLELVRRLDAAAVDALVRFD